MSFFHNPLITNAISTTAVASILGFSRANSSLRLVFMPILVTWTWVLLPYSTNGVSRRFYASILASQSLGMCLQYLEMGLLSRWSYIAQGPTSSYGGYSNHKAETADPPKVRASRARYMLDTIWDNRRAGSPWEVKHTPQFSEVVPSAVPPRGSFLFWKTAELVVCLFVIDLATAAHVNPNLNALMFTWARVPVLTRWRDITSEELLIRVAATSGWWIVQYCVLKAMYNVLAIPLVLFRVTEVREWRPLFGPLRQSWSIRQFWGFDTLLSLSCTLRIDLNHRTFWHQVMRQRLCATAHFITYRVLCLRKHTLPSRYIFLFLTFAVSGLFHSLSDTGIGIDWEQNGTLRFFVTQALGIMIEDGVQAAFRVCTARMGRYRPYSRWLESKMLGYSWVVIWLCWTSPSSLYPALCHQTGTDFDKILPSSLVKMGYYSMQ